MSPRFNSTTRAQLLVRLPSIHRNWIGNSKAAHANADLSDALDHVEILELCSNTANDEMIAALGPMPQLRKLWIMDCALSDGALESIATWKALERIEIYLSRSPKNTSDSAPKITDAGIARLAELPRLHFLWLSNLPITDQTVKVISQMPGLDAVAVQACVNITDAGLAPLANLPRLRELNVYGTNITDAGLEIISRLKQLETLNISECPKITDDGVRLLLNMPNLKMLELRPPTQISPAVLQELKRHISTVSTD